jgi:hypothetical protein
MPVRDLWLCIGSARQRHRIAFTMLSGTSPGRASRPCNHLGLCGGGGAEPQPRGVVNVIDAGVQ